MAKRKRRLERPTKPRKRWFEKLPPKVRREIIEHLEDKISGRDYQDWTIKDLLTSMQKAGLIPESVCYETFGKFFRDMRERSNGEAQ